MRFVKPAVISETSSVTAVQYKEPQSHKADTDITIGSAAKDFITTHEVQLRSRLQDFYCEVKTFYIRACDYMMSKFPFDDPVLLNAEVADISKRLHTSFQQVMPEECTLDKLEEEFLTYQVAALPAAVIMAERLDTAWHLISQTKDPVTGNRRFQNISAVMSYSTATGTVSAYSVLLQKTRQCIVQICQPRRWVV